MDCLPRADSADVKAALDQHRAEPGVTREQYLRRLRIELGQSLASRRAIYLDTNYWIFLRDAQLGRARESAHRALLEELRKQVALGKAFCPISAATFVEVLKQSDPESRAATAVLIEELSLGVALGFVGERASTEIAYLFYEHGTPKRELHPRRNLVWVRLPLVLGAMYPEVKGSRFAEKRAIEKALIDRLWNSDIRSMLAQVEDPRELTEALAQDALRLNEANDAHAHELKSFEDTYQREMEGVLDLFAGVGVDVIEHLFERETGQTANSSPESRKQHGPHVYGLLVAIARAGKAAHAFPTLYVHARCHAANRWDRLRRLDGNTLLDFHHAVAALPYCDVFLTERGMGSFLTAGHMKFDRDFACRVVSDGNEALKYVRALN